MKSKTPNWYVFLFEDNTLHLAYPGTGYFAGMWFFETDNVLCGTYELLGRL